MKSVRKLSSNGGASTMVSPKFNEADRGLVIRKLEEQYAVRLSQVGRRKKHLKDESGTTYWVFGGYDNWHGLPGEMMDAEVASSDDGVLVIAQRSKNQLTVYRGSLRPLVKNRSKLKRTQTGDFQFHIRVKGRRMNIDEVPEAVLEEIGTMSYTERERTKVQNTTEAKAMLAKLSPIERQRLLAELREVKD